MHMVRSETGARTSRQSDCVNNQSIRGEILHTKHAYRVTVEALHEKKNVRYNPAAAKEIREK